jgi:hypothetical protein
MSNYNICAACGAEYIPESGSLLCPACIQKINGTDNKKPGTPHIQHEAAEQEAVFEWASYMSMSIPELTLLFHIPNGGTRNKLEAQHLKKQGVKAGVPDLFLPVARGKYHGLFIEMKYGENRPTTEQLQWAKNLIEQGYKCLVCYNWTSATNNIQQYLNLPQTLAHDLKG